LRPAVLLIVAGEATRARRSRTASGLDGASGTDSRKRSSAATASAGGATERWSSPSRYSTAARMVCSSRARRWALKLGSAGFTAERKNGWETGIRLFLSLAPGVIGAHLERREERRRENVRSCYPTHFAKNAE
jgi:hypothetical protein